MQLDLAERALLDIRQARSWYEEQGRGLGDRLYDDVLATVDKVLLNPQFFAEWKPGLRSARCRRFPYRVIYRIREDVVRVLAVYHLNRDPDRWDEPNR
jgi:plasmid stabilization system protein ParE